MRTPDLSRVRKNGIDSHADCFCKAPLGKRNGTPGGEPKSQVPLTSCDQRGRNRGRGATGRTLGNLGSGSRGSRSLPLHHFNRGTGDACGGTRRVRSSGRRNRGGPARAAGAADATAAVCAGRGGAAIEGPAAAAEVGALSEGPLRDRFCHLIHRRFLGEEHLAGGEGVRAGSPNTKVFSVSSNSSMRLCRRRHNLSSPMTLLAILETASNDLLWLSPRAWTSLTTKPKSSYV